MFSIVKNIIISIFPHAFDDKEVVFSCPDGIELRFTTRSLGQTKIDSISTIVLAKEEKEELVPHEKQLIVVKNLSDVHQSKNDALYAFVYISKDHYKSMVDRFNDAANLKHCLILGISEFGLIFLLNCLNSRNGTNSQIPVKINDIATHFDRYFHTLLCIILIFLCHLICIVIIGYVEKHSPLFAGFNVLSSDIVKFKSFERPDTNICTICFDEFIGEDEVRMLECKHYFHSTCIDRWLVGHSNKCPCCRNKIEIEEKI